VVLPPKLRNVASSNRPIGEVLVKVRRSGEVLVRASGEEGVKLPFWRGDVMRFGAQPEGGVVEVPEYLGGAVEVVGRDGSCVDVWGNFIALLLLDCIVVDVPPLK
jgi:hypothetical protein